MPNDVERLQKLASSLDFSVAASSPSAEAIHVRPAKVGFVDEGFGGEGADEDEAGETAEAPPPDASEDGIADAAPAVAPPASRKYGRGRGARGVPRPTQTAPKGLEKLVPSSERLRIYKRDELGKAQLIPREYTLRDLEEVGDAERFIQKYLVPVWGHGDYVVALINAKGERTREVAISIAPDPSKTQIGSLDAATAKTIDRLFNRLEQLETKAAAPTDTASITKQLNELESARNMLTGSRIDPTALLMMIQQGQRTATADPAIAELKAELRTLQERLQRPAVIPPPLPPLPVDKDDPLDVAALVKSVAEAAKPQIPIQDIIALARPPQAEKSVGFGEILAGVQAIAPLLKSMFGGDQIPLLMQQLQNLQTQIQQQQASATRGIRETLNDVQLITSLATKLAPRTDTDFWSNLVDRLPETVGALSSLVANIKARDGAAAANDDDDDDDESVNEPEATPLEIPATATKHIKKIEEAADDGARVQSTIKLLQHLGKTEPWRARLIEIVKLARNAKADKSKQAEILAFLRDFLKKTGLPDATQQTVATAFETNLSLVINFIAGK